MERPLEEEKETYNQLLEPIRVLLEDQDLEYCLV